REFAVTVLHVRAQWGDGQVRRLNIAEGRHVLVPRLNRRGGGCRWASRLGRGCRRGCGCGFRRRRRHPLIGHGHYLAERTGPLDGFAVLLRTGLVQPLRDDYPAAGEQHLKLPLTNLEQLPDAAPGLLDIHSRAHLPAENHLERCHFSLPCLKSVLGSVAVSTQLNLVWTGCR